MALSELSSVIEDSNVEEIPKNPVLLNMQLVKIHFVPITMANLNELRGINQVLFPMSYSDKYYREVLAVDSFSRLVFYKQRLAGSFSCRIQHYYAGDRPHLECYIMTFGVLAPFRKIGIGTEMLKSILEYYNHRTEVRRIALHVHTINEVAIKFYLSHGFKLVETLPNHYRRLQPSSALLLNHPIR